MRIITADHLIDAVEKALKEEDVPTLLEVWFANAPLLAEIDAKWVESHRFRVYDILMHGGVEDPDGSLPVGAKLH